MGIKRIVDTSFWTDGKVDEFTPEDKYFMLYLLTNPFTTQLGIYEISVKQVAFQLGYSMDAVRNLIDRFESKYGIILYSPETKEIAIKNFLRHSIVKGGAPVRDCLIKEIEKVKDKSLIEKVFAHIDPLKLNATVRQLIDEYSSKDRMRYSNEKDKEKENDNDKENDNENENEVSFASSERIVPNPQNYPNYSPSVENSVENRGENSDEEVKPFKGNVMLSENQIADLLEQMEIADFDYYVDRLDNFIKDKNAKISDHAAMILKWYREDKR
jgi:hypothetical protein